MAQGAVAQISKQSILTIGATVQDRITRVFRLIEEEFILREIEASNNGQTRIGTEYSDYRKDRQLLIKVSNNYSWFTGSSKTFRTEDIEIALSSLEKAFAKEIRKMVEKSIYLESRFFPDLKDETASHLCALFSLTLQKKGFFNMKSRNIYKECKKRFDKLELLDIMKPNSLDIEWKNPCFYPKYWRYLTIQKSLYKKAIEDKY